MNLLTDVELAEIEEWYGTPEDILMHTIFGKDDRFWYAERAHAIRRLLADVKYYQDRADKLEEFFNLQHDEDCTFDCNCGKADEIHDVLERLLSEWKVS